MSFSSRNMSFSRIGRWVKYVPDGRQMKHSNWIIYSWKYKIGHLRVAMLKKKVIVKVTSFDFILKQNHSKIYIWDRTRWDKTMHARYSFDSKVLNRNKIEKNHNRKNTMNQTWIASPWKLNIVKKTKRKK